MLVKAPIRGDDRHGSGYYGASRGSKPHRGIDIACYKGSLVLSACNGLVSKIGYPYNPKDSKKGHLRYVEVTDHNDNRYRYFYVDSHVNVGDEIMVGEILGETQGLVDIYPGITDHFHFEIIDNKGDYIDPTKEMTL